MGKSHGKIHIGTSGWHYKHWIGSFYPEDLKKSEYFNFYAQHFQTVEINNSFYKLPSEKTFTQWKEAASQTFIYAVKANRFITHMKKLKDPKTSVEKFFRNVGYLEVALGPILFQLPPKWKCNMERLETFLSALPRHYLYAMELREISWYNEQVYDLLKTHKVAFCIYELEYHQSPEVITADHIYIRLHGPGNKYEGSYSREAINGWAQKCKKWMSEGKHIYFYFDNDQKGYAVENALLLKKIVES